MAAAITLTVILALLAVFQLALALGAPLGRFAWGGAHRVLPARLRVGSLVSIVIYAVIAVLALDRVDLIDVVPDAVAAVGMWVVFGYFVLGIVTNAISRSKPERVTMTPVVAVLAVLSLLVALS
ncbi:hypothetical protein [Agromyces kandeliae]|uniref:Integral membrane protein n=1 Tax=Agromyces kandeliae TaxID=2666141 RepID=A0A6L5QY88_9MICO|nr:hypothetical protein [Agromyces kandeliae]MRX42118.1 hypothetical protein [Agromyces kandeliae]